MKKLISAFILICIAFSFMACVGKSKKLVVWSFTDELGGYIDNYWKKDFPDKYEIEYTSTTRAKFSDKLTQALESGKGVPDVFALEDSFVRKYIESGPEYLLDLTDIYNEIKDAVYNYPAQIASYNGRVYGLAWQVTPGAVFYRRSLAKKYLGTDDPDEVQKYLANWNKFMETAALIKEKSNGKCCITSSSQDDLFRPYASTRAKPWVVDGKLYVDRRMEEYMDLCKVMYENGYAAQILQTDAVRTAGIKGTLMDENGKPVECFSFFLPTWGLHYFLKARAPETSGDWAVCQGPVSYHWGGTWIAAYKGTKNPKAAKELIKYFAADPAFLERLANDTGDVVSNKNVVNKIKDSYSEPFLGGQNHYAAFANMVDNINGSLTQGSDQAIETLFSECVTAYIKGEKTKAAALTTFKQQVAETLGY
ncbi:MAG: carbohydrate ABC transporter substrate-binding protein [Spirochaetaceae bacterium]|nr:carbohydrate ABC transporter substrate-binding protein [Spirochaetaceae bacterium]